MKRSAGFVGRFALAPMISGPFVVSVAGTASGLEWAHIITGFVAVYLIFGLLLLSAKYPEMRLPASLALVASLLEAIPGMPRLHAAVSPVLFATLAWTAMTVPREQEEARGKSRLIFVLPGLVLLPIFYGVGYRHQTSGIVPHLGAGVPVAGLLLIFCAVMNERHPANVRLHRYCKLTSAAILLQITMGIVVWIIRLVEIEGGLWLAIARTAHITGAAVVLAAGTMLAIQYRRSVV